MTWLWEYLGASEDIVGRSEVFESRGDAETWIGEAFGDLLEQGIEQVKLLEGASERYLMSLRAE